MNKTKLDKSIIVGITGNKDSHWKNKLSEIEKFKIDRVALFLEQFSTKIQREKIYKAISQSRIKEIPLIHIRNEMDKDEISFLLKKFNNPYLTIHESSFKYLEKWKGFHKNLYLEMNYDNSIPGDVDVKKIGGFCVDLAHFKSGEERWSKDFLYEISKNKKYFRCNHLSGFSFKKNTDVHLAKSKEDFNYLKTLPEFIFGDAIAIEVYNSIAEQLEFKKYIIKLLAS